MSRLISHIKVDLPKSNFAISDSNGPERLEYLKSVAKVLTDNTSLILMSEEEYPYPDYLYSSVVRLGLEGDTVPKFEIGNGNNDYGNKYQANSVISFRPVFVKDDNDEWRIPRNTNYIDNYNLANAYSVISSNMGNNKSVKEATNMSQAYMTTRDASTGKQPITVHILKFDDGTELISFQSYNFDRGEYLQNFAMLICNVIHNDTDRAYRTIVYFKSGGNIFTSYIEELNGTSFQLDGLIYPPGDLIYPFSRNILLDPLSRVRSLYMVDKDTDVLINYSRLCISNSIRYENPNIFLYSNRNPILPGNKMIVGDNEYFCFATFINENSNLRGLNNYDGVKWLIKIS